MRFRNAFEWQYQSLLAHFQKEDNFILGISSLQLATSNETRQLEMRKAALVHLKARARASSRHIHPYSSMIMVDCAVARNCW